MNRYVTQSLRVSRKEKQMNVELSNASRRMRRPALVAAAALVISAGLGVIETVVPTPVHALTNNLTTANLQVRDATTGDPIAEFQYIINVDNTGTTEQRSPIDDCSPEAAGYPDSCNWTSMGVASSSPVLTQGDQTDFVAGLSMPDGRYLISVLADGYKLDGAHFTMPLDDAAIVEVLMQAPPLPDATIQAAVFEDISPVNGAPDLPAEHGLAGWTGRGPRHPRRGHDRRVRLAAVRQRRLLAATATSSTAVSTSASSSRPTPWAVARRSPTNSRRATRQVCSTRPTSAPVPAASTTSPSRRRRPSRARSRSRTSARTDSRSSVTPPDGSDFVQTTTLEGNHDWDAWIMEGTTGLDTEFVVAGEPFPAIIFGYTPGQLDPLSGSGTITGVIDAVKVYVPANGGLPNGGQIWAA